MGFSITSKMIEKRIYPGMVITYKFSPVLRIKMNWVTEITHIRAFKYYMDEQRIG